jgi:hypothetical protein
MKVVHSFSSKELIWKELMYTQALSALLAKKHYGNIHFYGTEKLAKQVVDAGLEYDSIDDKVINEDDSTTFSIPKIKVFQSINEEFLHIDTDTLIFDKLDFTKHQSPFVFSHPDILIDHFKDGLRGSLNSLFTHLRTFERPEKRFFYDFNNTYLGLFIRLQHKLSDSVIKAFDAGSIPNMNIVYVKDPTAFKYACEKTLEHYKEVKYDVDAEQFGPCYIEQLILHLNLRAIDKKYKYFSDENKHVMFPEMPFLPGEEHNLIANVDEIKYPLKFTVPNIKCKCCDSVSDRKHSIESREEFKDYLDFNFHGFYHATFMKWYEHFQAIIINKIVTEFGEEPVLKIHNYFKKVYPSHNLPLISGGEKFYEELTGSTIFTNLKQE